MLEIQLTNRDFCTYVSDCDTDVVSSRSWFAKQSRHGWYACCSIKVNDKVKTVRLHRLIMKCPDDMTVDHIDFDHWNNCRENLRIVDNETNAGRQRRFNEEDRAEREYGG